MLRLALLGPLRVAISNQPLKLSRRQPLAILAYLTLTTQPVAREQLQLLLFGDCEPLLARERLRRPLSDLRQALCRAGLGEMITRRGEWLEFNHQQCYLDVHQFMDARTSNDPTLLTKALTLYRGPLLEGFQLPNAPDFEHWLLTEREHIDLIHQDILTRLIDTAVTHNDWNTVVTYARTLIEIDPLQEDAHLRLMEAYAAQGHTGLVNRQYVSLCTTLRRELDVEPLPETHMRYQHLLHGEHIVRTPVSRVRLTSHAVPLCGRDRELRALQTAYERMCIGNLHIVAVAGPSGIGKTRLIQDYIATLTDVTIVQATAYRTTIPAPYQMLVEAFVDILPKTTNPFQQAYAADTNTSGEQRFWEELVQTIRHTATPRPLILTLDDLQWADPTLLRALPYLIRRLAHTPILILLAYRNDDSSPTFNDLLQLFARSDKITWITLAPLDEQATHAVVHAFSQHSDTCLSARLYSETKGNPFFLTEILRILHGRGELTTYDPDQPLPLPQSIRVAIEERWSRLPKPAQRIGEIAAVLGRSVSLTLLRQVACESEDNLVHLIEQLEHTGFLISQVNEYTFAHNLLQTIIYEHLSVARRQLLHRHIATTLWAHCGPGMAALVVTHAQQAADWDTVFTAARQAAHDARQVLAFADALRFETLARQSLIHLGNPLIQRVNALFDEEYDLHRLGHRIEQDALLDVLEPLAAQTERLAEALYRRGRYWSAIRRWPEAQGTLEQALIEAQTIELQHSIQLELSYCLACCGAVDQAIQTAHQVLVTSQNAGMSAQRLKALLTLIEIAAVQGDSDQMLHWTHLAKPLAYTTPDTLAHLWLLQAQAHMRSTNSYHQTMKEAQQAYNIYHQINDPYGQAKALMTQGMAAGRSRHFAEAQNYHERALAILRLLDDDASQAITLSNLALTHKRIANHHECIAFSEQAYQLSQKVGDQQGGCVSALNLAAGYFWLGNGNKEEFWARIALQHAEALTSALLIAVAYQNIGGALFLQGGFEPAITALQQACTLRPANDVDQVYDYLLLAAIYLAQDDHTAAINASTKAITFFEQHSNVEHPEMIYAMSSYICWHTNDPLGATAYLQSAREQLQQSLASLSNATDRQRYLTTFPFNRFIHSAQQGDWHTHHPLRAT